MKIGILTFHDAMNYGAVLQAYALQKKLSALGAKPEIINYVASGMEFESKLIKPNDKKDIKLAAKILFRWIKRKEFSDFIKKNIPVSIKVDYKGLHKLGGLYEAVIVGSDQVWNDSCIKGDNSFVLSFVPHCKRYSYAVSTGGSRENTDRFIERYSRDIAGFQTISVRENNTYNIFKEKYNNVRLDVDPVLLLDGGEWMQVTSNRLYTKQYAFLYVVGGVNNIKRFAADYARKKGLVLIDNKTSVEFMKHCSPSDFLSWIAHADTVITNSFHGTAFSVVFRKNFFSEYELKPGYNFRSEQLLTSIEVAGREIVTPCYSDDYEKATYTEHSVEILYDMRYKSVRYLTDIIEANNE